MANFSIAVGTQWSFADHATDFAPTAVNTLENGAQTNVQMQLASVATAAAVNSTQVDLGASRARLMSVDAAIEFAATPTIGATVDFYWSGSPNSTASDGNPGNADGSDGAYTGDGTSSVAEAVLNMQYIGSMITTDRVTTGVQVAHIGIFSPAHRYGQMVVVNNSAASFHSDDVESHVVMTELQDTDA